MKVKVTVKSTHEEIEILKSASKIIDTIAEDIDNEGIDTFTGLGDTIYEILEIILMILLKNLKNLRRREKNNG